MTMRIFILTSCTGEKSVSDPRALTLEDFARGTAHVHLRERELQEKLTPAEDLYSGLQHQRLMRRVHKLRNARRIETEVWILSAGYGLVQASRKLAPYEATFAGMKKRELKEWSTKLEVPAHVRQVLATKFDLGLMLLGEHYLEACDLDDSVSLGGPTLLFCGKATARTLPNISGLHPIFLTNADATRFSCGLIGLKGELAGRILEAVAAGTIRLPDLVTDGDKLLDKMAESTFSVRPAPKVSRANATVDQVIHLRDSWYEKPHRSKLSYFIPEWDDLVDSDFDFESDMHSGGSGDWSNEVYAHQMYVEPNYDGILISKVIAEKTKKKKERINRLGVHRYLRVPPEFPIMGDCGAFGYISQDVPPYTTNEILDYYTGLGFDLGVSVDHLIVTATEATKNERYELTINNAEEFLREHKNRRLPWTAIGAVQGWDPRSYADAARQYVAMGYKYIGLGGLVRTSTIEILRVLEEVKQFVPDSVRIHLFGLARIARLGEFARLGVRSVDSASFLRRAWLADANYFTLAGEHFAAIRIPEAEKSYRAKRMVTEERASLGQVKLLEKACLAAVRGLDRGETSPDEVLSVLHEYDQLITPDRPDNREVLMRTLDAKPWKSCPCEICQSDGAEVIIFRGNNRNRRRGFHNTFVFYRLLQRVLAGEQIVLSRGELQMNADQLPLFESSGVL